MKRKLILIIVCVFILIGWYFFRFYPQQQMPVGKPVFIATPEPEKYHDDCLHPCIRKLNDGSYVMVQSPYYAWNNKVENPMVYRSTSLADFGMGKLLEDTPSCGYNSDPNVFVEDSSIYVFWRECGTPICQELGTGEIVLGGKIDKLNNLQFVANYIYNQRRKVDFTICPILMRHDENYYFYVAWCQYGQEKEYKGMAVWKGTSLKEPDFQLVDTILFDNPLVCDKLFQKRIGNRIYYIPIPKRYKLWHFDLFEYEDKLYMVWCAEKDDNIMLSVSTDWKHFKTIKRPLINNHCSENSLGYRQYYYKPTAIVQHDSLYLYYTANAHDDPNRNQLFLSIKAMKDLGLNENGTFLHHH